MDDFAPLGMSTEPVERLNRLTPAAWSAIDHRWGQTGRGTRAGGKSRLPAVKVWQPS